MKLSSLIPPMVMVKGILASMLVIILMTVAAYDASAKPVLFRIDNVKSLYWYDPDEIRIHGSEISTILVIESVKAGETKYEVSVAGRFIINCDDSTIGMAEAMLIDRKSHRLFYMPVPTSGFEMSDIGEHNPVTALKNFVCNIL